MKSLLLIFVLTQFIFSAGINLFPVRIDKNTVLVTWYFNSSQPESKYLVRSNCLASSSFDSIETESIEFSWLSNKQLSNLPNHIKQKATSAFEKAVLTGSIPLESKHSLTEAVSDSLGKLVYAILTANDAYLALYLGSATVMNYRCDDQFFQLESTTGKVEANARLIQPTIRIDTVKVSQSSTGKDVLLSILFSKNKEMPTALARFNIININNKSKYRKLVVQNEQCYNSDSLKCLFNLTMNDFFMDSYKSTAQVVATYMNLFPLDTFELPIWKPIIETGLFDSSSILFTPKTDTSVILQAKHFFGDSIPIDSIIYYSYESTDTISKVVSYNPDTSVLLSIPSELRGHSLFITGSIYTGFSNWRFKPVQFVVPREFIIAGQMNWQPNCNWVKRNGSTYLKIDLTNENRSTQVQKKEHYNLKIMDSIIVTFNKRILKYDMDSLFLPASFLQDSGIISFAEMDGREHWTSEFSYNKANEVDFISLSKSLQWGRCVKLCQASLVLDSNLLIWMDSLQIIRYASGKISSKTELILEHENYYKFDAIYDSLQIFILSTSGNKIKIFGGKLPEQNNRIELNCPETVREWVKTDSSYYLIRSYKITNPYQYSHIHWNESYYQFPIIHKPIVVDFSKNDVNISGVDSITFFRTKVIEGKFMKITSDISGTDKYLLGSNCTDSLYIWRDSIPLLSKLQAKKQKNVIEVTYDSLQDWNREIDSIEVIILDKKRKQLDQQIYLFDPLGKLLVSKIYPGPLYIQFRLHHRYKNQYGNIHELVFK